MDKRDTALSFQKFICTHFKTVNFVSVKSQLVLAIASSKSIDHTEAWVEGQQLEGAKKKKSNQESD